MKRIYDVPSYFNNNKGSALVLVLLLVVVISILGVSLLGATLHNVRLSSIEREYQAVYYIAEAGVNYKVQEMQEKVLEIYQSSVGEDNFFQQAEHYFAQPTILDSFEISFGKRPQAEVKVEKMQRGKYKIISKGTIDQRTRVLEKNVELNWGHQHRFPTDMALFSMQSISLAGGAIINGDMGTNSTATHSVKFSGGAGVRHGDSIYVGPGGGNEVVLKEAWMTVPNPIPLIQPRSYPLPPFPEFPTLPRAANRIHNGYPVISNGRLQINNSAVDKYTLDLTQDLSFSEVIIDSNFTLNINVGNQDRKMVVDKLDIITGHVKIIGSGKLTIYVNESITMGSGSTINTNQDNKTENLNIFLKATTPAQSFVLGGAQKIFGSFYAQNATIVMEQGGGFQGNIITGGNSLRILGGAYVRAQVMYAPHAHVQIRNGGNVLGAVIAHSFFADGGSKVTHSQIDTSSFLPVEGEIQNLLVTYPSKEN